MKKLIIGLICTGILAGCTNKNMEYFEVKAEKEQTVTQYDFNYDVTLSYDEKLKVEVEVENKEGNYIPLNYKENNFFIVELYDQSKEKLIKKEVIKTDKRTQIQSSEDVNYELYFDVPKSGSYEVKVTQQLENTKTNKYDKVLPYLKKDIDIELKHTGSYHPIEYAKKRNCEYKYKTADGSIVTSRYNFYKGSMIQGVSGKYGMVIFAETDKGLMFKNIADYVGDVSALDYITEDDMQLLIPSNPTVGQNWKNGGYKMTVMGVNASTKTNYGNFEGLIKIQSKRGKEIKELYFDKALGLVKITKKNNSIIYKKEITELQLSDVKLY